jgi:Holliday junction resolvase RusA-like endonuclease
MKVELTIPYAPVPWAAPKLSKYRCYDPREADKRAIRFLMREQYDGDPYENYVAILFYFAFEPPKSTSLRNRARMLLGEIRPTKCDCTNLQKLYEDCLKGIVIKDDRHVCAVSSYKCYEQTASVHIIVQDLREYFQEHEEGLKNAVKEG